jgi:hypothetical protein
VDVTHAAEIDRLKQLLQEQRQEEQKKSGPSSPPSLRKPTLKRLRDLLFASIEADDLKWFTLDLKMGSRAGPAAYTIQVCSPVMVGGYFVPVTAKETWDLAVKFEALPLTQAVADQQLNEASDKGLFVEHMPQPAGTTNDHLPAFDEFADTLLGTKYASEYGVNPVSGSHKLWVMSALLTNAKPRNYGFYHKGPRVAYAQGDSGPYLYPEYTVVNGLIPAHDWYTHWDYSQLLQLMKGLKEGVKLLDLRQAIKDKHPAVWKEKPPLDKSSFPDTQWPGTRKF